MLKIDFSRQGNFILTLILIHFIFFGYICNVYEKSIGLNILFLYRVLFNPYSYLSSIILFVIVFIMAFRETFYEYGIRNSIWLILFIVIESWIWYWIIFKNFDILIIIFYFSNLESYITILSLLGISLLASILGSAAKYKYKQRIKKILMINKDM
ncbi:MAG: hypothetical protein ACTSUX_09455 [Promethearchaeota archaeon]